MKVVFLTARYPPDVQGGGELSTKILAEALVQSGVAVSVLTGAPTDARAEERGVLIHRLRSLHRWWGKPLAERPVSRETALVVQQALTALPAADLVHAHEFRSALALAAVSHPVRVVTIRDFAPICGTTNNLLADGSACSGCTWPHVLFRCHRVVEASPARKPFRVAQYKGNLAGRKRAYQMIPHHLYPSVHLRDTVTSRLGFHPRTTAVIANPIDPEWLAEPVRPLPDSPQFLAAGRLETTKGTDILLAAVARVRRSVPALHLHLAGGGEIARYQRLADDLNLRSAVTFHGPLPPGSVRALVDAARAVVSAHVWEEPFGRAALEAGARGRALVTSDRGGVRETTTTETSLRVPAGDQSALAQALRHLAEQRSLAEALGQNARTYVAQAFAPSAIAEQHRAHYQALIETTA